MSTLVDIIQGSDRSKLRAGLAMNAFSSLFYILILVLYSYLDDEGVDTPPALGIGLWLTGVLFTVVGFAIASGATRVPQVKGPLITMMVTTIVSNILLGFFLYWMLSRSTNNNVVYVDYTFITFATWLLNLLPTWIIFRRMTGRLMLNTDLGGLGIVRAGYTVSIVSYCICVPISVIIAVVKYNPHHTLFDYGPSVFFGVLLSLGLIVGMTLVVVGWFLVAYLRPGPIQVYTK